MRSTTLCRVWRTPLRGLPERSATRTHRSPQRTVSRSTSSSSLRFSPPPHHFENPSIRGQKHLLADAVLSPQAISWAESTVVTLDRPREKRSVFFDFSTATCNLCGVALTGSYGMHQKSADHTTRLDIIKRALGLLYTFYRQVQSTDPAAALSAPRCATPPSRRPRNSAMNGGSASSNNAASSCYDKIHSKSVLFDEEGVPSHELLHHRPASLRELDLVEVLLRRWWRTLNHVPAERGNYAFHRILSLSADHLHKRLHRLRYLLFFLTSRGVLRESVAVMNRSDTGTSATPSTTLHRTEAFERYEMIGDLEFKTMASDRMRAMFPADEGGVSGAMYDIVRILDSNHGLLAIYDYLNMDNLLSISMANNKSKADVVEALVGELRTLLWSGEVAYSTDAYAVPGDRATAVYLRHVVEHTLYELGHVVLMWRIDSTLRNVKDIMMSCLEKECSHNHSIGDGHSSSSTTETELSARAPKNALHPLLLPWERRYSGELLMKEEAEFAMARRPARPPHVFQAELQHLSSSPCEQSAEWCRTLSVTPCCRTAVLPAWVKTEVRAPAVAERSRNTDVLSSSQEPRTAAVTMVPLLNRQPTPSAHRPPLPSPADKRELVRMSCVVFLGPLPLTVHQ